MLEAVLDTLTIMGWLGIVLGILVIVNIATNTIYNIWSSKETFSWKKMIKGILKAVIFYVSAAAISIAFTILPFINEMIASTFGVVLISNEILETKPTTNYETIPYYRYKIKNKDIIWSKETSVEGYTKTGNTKI